MSGNRPTKGITPKVTSSTIKIKQLTFTEALEKYLAEIAEKTGKGDDEANDIDVEYDDDLDELNKHKEYQEEEEIDIIYDE